MVEKNKARNGMGTGKGQERLAVLKRMSGKVSLKVERRAMQISGGGVFQAEGMACTKALAGRVPQARQEGQCGCCRERKRES